MARERERERERYIYIYIYIEREREKERERAREVGENQQRGAGKALERLAEALVACRLCPGSSDLRTSTCEAVPRRARI